MEQTNILFKTLTRQDLSLPVERRIYHEVSFEAARDLDSDKILLDPNSVARLLAGTAILLVLASSAILTADYLTGYSSVVIHKMTKLFSLDLELNVPTFFSVLLFFMTSVLLGIVTIIRRKQNAPHIVEWAILSAGFLFMAFDEMASVHERLIEPMRAIFGIENLGFFYYAWVVPALALIAVFGIGFLKFLIHLPTRTRWAFMIAGAIFLGGAVGMELFEGVYGEGNLAYNIFVAIEESMEMGGVILFIWALLRYVSDSLDGGAVKLNFFTAEGNSSKGWAVKELGLQS